MTHSRFRQGAGLALLLAGLFLSGLTVAAGNELSIELQQQPWTGDLDGMIRRGFIRALVPYNHTLYFVDLGGTQRGISYEFMRGFEDTLNSRLGRGALRVEVVFIPVSRDQLLPMLVSGQGDIAAANLTITPQRQQLVDFTLPGARHVNEVIVTGPGAPPLNTLDDLAGKEIYVSRATSYYESLVTLNRKFTERGLIPMKLREAPGNFETEDVLEMANAGLVKVVVADRYIANLWRQVYPNIRVHEDLVVRENGDIAFAIRKNSPQFKAQLDAFSKSHGGGTAFGNVTLQRYLAQTRWVKNATSQDELKKFTTLVGLFQKYGKQYDIDWLLMAAQGYQESQLDQNRRSQVGAIGVMQVMPATAEKLQVGDINELEPNIHAGVKYIRQIVDEYYGDVPMDPLNKVLFAFASYNAGPTRIKGLRKEAQALGLNPNVWFDNVERVAAYRIGRETVQYVANIYKYYIAYTLVQEDVAQDLEQHSVH
ncbi:MAG TPA: transporter substrate-binding domain-containing protein [Steroidobacteraceae bacterium]